MKVENLKKERPTTYDNNQNKKRKSISEKTSKLGRDP